MIASIASILFAAVFGGSEYVSFVSDSGRVIEIDFDSMMYRDFDYSDEITSCGGGCYDGPFVFEFPLSHFDDEVAEWYAGDAFLNRLARLEIEVCGDRVIVLPIEIRHGGRMVTAYYKSPFELVGFEFAGFGRFLRAC